MTPAPFRLLALPLVAALLVAAPLPAADPPPTPAPAASAEAPAPRKIAVTAKKFEFNPSTIEVALGERIELTISSLDKVHGFACRELGLAGGEISPDKPLVVTFTADKAGEFEFKCSKFCGIGHGRMKGKIVVR